MTRRDRRRRLAGQLGQGLTRSAEGEEGADRPPAQPEREGLDLGRPFDPLTHQRDAIGVELGSDRVVPPALLPGQLVAEAERITTVPVALYLLDIDGSRLLRIAGDVELSVSPPLSLPPVNACHGRDSFDGPPKGKGSPMQPIKGGRSMAKRTGRDKDLFDRLRSLGVRKGAARKAAKAIRDSDRPAPKEARRVAGDLMGAVSELQKEMNRVPQKRQEAARKAARTRAANSEKRSKAAEKAARTRARAKG